MSPMSQWELLDITDSAMSDLPSALRLMVWGLVGAVSTMALYALLSPQTLLAGLRAQIGTVRKELASYDGDFIGMWRLLNCQLKLSAVRVAIVTPATLLSALPLLFLIGWLSTRYSHEFPAAGDALTVCVQPASAGVKWIPPAPAMQASNCWRPTWPALGHVVTLSDRQGNPILTLPVDNPIPAIERYKWWNAILPNRLGYLGAAGEISEIRLDFPRRAVLPSLPSWFSGWETFFFTSLITASLVVKRWFRIV